MRGRSPAPQPSARWARCGVSYQNSKSGGGAARPPAPPALSAEAPGKAEGWPRQSFCAGASRNKGRSGLGTGVNKLWSENHRAWCLGLRDTSRDRSAPKGANQAGGRGLPRSSEERPGGSRWRWSPGHKRKIRKQSLTVTWAEPEGLGPGWSPQDCSGGEGALTTAVRGRGLGFPLSCMILLPTTGLCQRLQPAPGLVCVEGERRTFVPMPDVF